LLLEICLLGGFGLAREDRPLPGPKSKKGRLLVAHLALHAGRELLRSDLSAHLWPDLSEDKALFNLRQLLSTIRRESPDLGGQLKASDRRTLSFDSADTLIDATEFRRLIKDESHVGSALELYRGVLLPGIQDNWIDPLRAELEECYIAGVEVLVAECEPRAAVRWLRKAIEFDPYRESLQQKLLVRLIEGGDVAAAHVAFRQFRQLLHHEMNSSPSPETEALYRRLVDSGPGVLLSRDQARFRLPAPTTELLGRETDIREVCRLLETSRLVTLLGAGGAGKTRLSIAVGERELARRRDGAWFVDLSELNEEARVPQTVGKALNLPEPARGAWNEALVEGIGAGERLLILDNCEHLVEATARLASTLLSRCEGLKILATSRLPLAAEGEHRYRVPSLALPDEASLEPEEYLRYPALELFQSRARQVSPGFLIDRQNVDLAIAICREVDGMPLGIEMAAARLAALSIEDVARRLDQKLSFLRNSSKTAIPRRQTLGAVLDWSYGLLPGNQQTLLRRLSVFAGGWTIGAAERVCGFGSLSPEEILERLVGLVEASMASYVDGRYLVLETVRQFASDLLATDEDERAVRDRHLEYFNDFCKGVDEQVGLQGPDRAALHYKPELKNIRSALAWSLRSGSEEGFELGSNAAIVFSILQLDGEAVSWLQQLLALKTREPASLARISALTQACRFYQSQCADFDRPTARENTIGACEELARLALQIDDRLSLAEAHMYLGAVRLWWEPQLARESLAEALAINLTLPEQGRSYRPLRLLAQAAYDAHSFEESRDYYERSYSHAEKRGDLGWTITCLQGLSHLCREHCQYEEARAKLVKIQRLLAKMPDARASAFNDLRFAELSLDAWDFAAMAEPLSRARSFFGESRKRLHCLLIDGLSRYLAAREGRLTEAVTGVGQVVSQLVHDAAGNPSACWHGASIELESLSYSLASLGKRREGARMFGAAQALREKDWAYLSPSVKARWQRLEEAASFGGETDAIKEGRCLTPEQVIEAAQEMEWLILETSLEGCASG
jgi:predicted ATPase/DNA-binding SARP family transcriptional activator